jgi:hypothetical protein
MTQAAVAHSDTLEAPPGPIAAGLLVATVGYARMFQIMALVGLTATMVLSLASRDGAVTNLPQEM